MGPRRKILMALLLLMPATVSCKAYANETPEVKETRVQVSKGTYGTGLNIFLGLDLGLLGSLSERTNKESHKWGPSLGIKGILSGYVEHFVIDAGLGWFKSHMTGKSMTPERAATDVESIDTQIGFAEWGVRYRLTPRSGAAPSDFERSGWEWGPTALVTFGADSQFSPLAGSKTSNVFLGASLVAPYRSHKGAWRWGVTGLTDLTINQRQMFLILLSLQGGIPLLDPTPERVEITREQVKYTQEDPIKEQEKAPTPENATHMPHTKGNPNEAHTSPCQGASRSALIMGPIINFQTARYEITDRDKAYLKDMLAVLNEKPKAWEFILISGHTDSRGSADRNKKLAQKRSEAVLNALTALGVDKERVRVHLFASEARLNEEKDALERARNRRVEVKIDGVEKPEDLASAFEGLYRTYHTPSTCKISGCL